jgi:hypothetical protein
MPAGDAAFFGFSKLLKRLADPILFERTTSAKENQDGAFRG